MGVALFENKGYVTAEFDRNKRLITVAHPSQWSTLMIQTPRGYCDLDDLQQGNADAEIDTAQLVFKLPTPYNFCILQGKPIDDTAYFASRDEISFYRQNGARRGEIRFCILDPYQNLGGLQVVVFEYNP